MMANLHLLFLILTKMEQCNVTNISSMRKHLVAELKNHSVKWLKRIQMKSRNRQVGLAVTSCAYVLSYIKTHWL